MSQNKPTIMKPTTPFYMQDVQDQEYILPSDTSANSSSSDLWSRAADLATDYSTYKASGEGLSSIAQIAQDGRIALSLDLKHDLPDLPQDYAKRVEEFAVDQERWREVPHMNIVIMIVGSRGDVQPYLALGKLLKRDGNRVRIATHKTFDSFVAGAGLEFFDIGGNPQDLMSYMVKNPGLMPGMESLLNGDIPRKRKMLAEMIHGCWLSCNSPSDEGRPFFADAIISNPPAFAHIHCAEALGIPLQLSFTMPWSPTTAFPHPLVNVKESNAQRGLTNYLSYAVADLLTWQGVGDIINDFRTRNLGLPPLSLRSGPGLQDRVKVPWTYCMSPALVPKPQDWKNHIDVVGFYFLDLASDYRPPQDLSTFLYSGEPPIYIGFGSVVVDDPVAMSQLIFDATASAGVRALVSAGWGGLGGVSVPPHVFILGNVPHDWLFANDRVAAVVHHGGAGTTAIGLAHGRPTVVVPFFGDQGFWGSMIHKAGAGPAPIPHKELNATNLTEAIKFAISPAAKEAARRMAVQISQEDGVQSGVDSFYRHLPLLNMRCDLEPSKLAIWWSTKHCLKLSNFAAQVLIDQRQINASELELHRTKEYNSRKQVSDPVSGGAGAIFWTVTHYYASIAEIFYSPVDGIIHTTTAIPEGIMKIVASVHEGFHNAPTLYGSEVRQRGKVTGFRSGLKEAGRGFFYGYYDGITGLVREPIRGARQEGFIGAIKGSARSFVNVTVRPAAGIMGLIALPAQGIWKSMQIPSAQKYEQHQFRARVDERAESTRGSTAAQRSEVFRKFKQMEVGLPARRKKYENAAEVFMLQQLEDLPTEQVLQAPEALPTAPTTDGRSPAGNRVPEDEAYHRDLELALQRSLEDQ